jgi:biopolymer transport protein ExbD
LAKCTALVLSGIWEWKRERVSVLSATSIFPETLPRNVIALKRHRPTLVILDLSMFGPTWFGVIAALSVVFLLHQTKPLMRYGLPIDFPKHYAATGSKSPWPETLAVYVDAHRRFHVNGELTKPENLEQKLREELGRRIVWTVYVEGDGDPVFEDTVFAMDAVQGLGGKVVWITPMMREEGLRNARSCRERKSSGVSLCRIKRERKGSRSEGPACGRQAAAAKARRARYIVALREKT